MCFRFPLGSGVCSLVGVRSDVGVGVGVKKHDVLCGCVCMCVMLARD
jgi:hypothetical protein